MNDNYKKKRIYSSIDFKEKVKSNLITLETNRI